MQFDVVEICIQIDTILEYIWSPLLSTSISIDVLIE